MKKNQEMDTNPVDIDMTMQSVGLCLLKCIVNTVVDFLNVLTDAMHDVSNFASSCRPVRNVPWSKRTHYLVHSSLVFWTLLSRMC